MFSYVSHHSHLFCCSWAVSGYGNPYLYFMCGGRLSGAWHHAPGATLLLEGHRQMQALEPRYFRTEERGQLHGR